LQRRYLIVVLTDGGVKGISGIPLYIGGGGGFRPRDPAQPCPFRPLQLKAGGQPEPEEICPADDLFDPGSPPHIVIIIVAGHFQRFHGVHAPVGAGEDMAPRLRGYKVRVDPAV
jgi:hypothetical protein